MIARQGPGGLAVAEGDGHRLEAMGCNRACYIAYETCRLRKLAETVLRCDFPG
jgi:hypothetical protein